MCPVVDIGLVAETPSSEGCPQAASHAELATITKIELQVLVIAPHTPTRAWGIKHRCRSKDNASEEDAKESMCSNLL
jgi:hypothetical protein